MGAQKLVLDQILLLLLLAFFFRACVVAIGPALKLWRILLFLSFLRSLLLARLIEIEIRYDAAALANILTALATTLFLQRKVHHSVQVGKLLPCEDDFHARLLLALRPWLELLVAIEHALIDGAGLVIALARFDHLEKVNLI